MLKLDNTKFRVTFTATAEMLRGKRIDPELVVDLELTDIGHVKVSVLAPKHFLGDFIDFAERYATVFEIKADCLANINKVRAKEVSKFLNDPYEYRHLAVSYWPIFENSPFYKNTI